jgi:hypothetical protein
VQVEESVSIPAARVVLEAEVAVPEYAPRILVIAHGSGSCATGRARLRRCRICRIRPATALADLLTPAEEKHDAFTTELRFVA